MNKRVCDVQVPRAHLGSKVLNNRRDEKFIRESRSYNVLLKSHLPQFRIVLAVAAHAYFSSRACVFGSSFHTL